MVCRMHDRRISIEQVVDVIMQGNPVQNEDDENIWRLRLERITVVVRWVPAEEPTEAFYELLSCWEDGGEFFDESWNMSYAAVIRKFTGCF